MIEIINAWQNKKVLILGDAMNDVYIRGQVTRRSPEADCPVFLVERKETYPGGAANVRANVLALGGIGTLISPLDRSTKTRIVQPDGHILRIDEDRSTHDIGPAVVEKLLGVFAGSIRYHDVVILSDYAKGCLCDEILLPAIRIARDAGKPIVVDPKREDWSAYKGADYFTPNWRELAQCVTEGHELAVAATQGEHGVIVYEPGKPSAYIPERKVDVQEVSGAGDTFVATFALALSSGAEFFDAAVIANRAASIAVSKPGTATVTAKELRAAL